MHPTSRGLAHSETGLLVLVTLRAFDCPSVFFFLFYSFLFFAAGFYFTHRLDTYFLLPVYFFFVTACLLGIATSTQDWKTI